MTIVVNSPTFTRYTHMNTVDGLLAITIRRDRETRWWIKGNGLEPIVPTVAPDLPPGFADNYTDETSRSDDPKLLATKAQYFLLWETNRAAILTALDAMSEAELAEPVPESMHRYADTVAAAFRHVGTHELMHAGQLVAVRRRLGKPVLI